MASIRYRHIKSQLRLHRIYFLPKRFSPTGTYSARIHQRTVAYHIHCHAEIESFLEASSQFLFDTAESVTRLRNPASPLLSVVQTHSLLIKKNHGIKEANVKTMFACFGFDFAALPTRLMANLNSFGVARGAYAHSSRTAVALLDPQSELVAVSQIITDLTDFDAEVRRLATLF